MKKFLFLMLVALLALTQVNDIKAIGKAGAKKEYTIDSSVTDDGLVSYLREKRKKHKQDANLYHTILVANKSSNPIRVSFSGKLGELIRTNTYKIFHRPIEEYAYFSIKTKSEDGSKILGKPQCTEVQTLGDAAVGFKQWDESMTTAVFYYCDGYTRDGRRYFNILPYAKFDLDALPENKYLVIRDEKTVEGADTDSGCVGRPKDLNLDSCPPYASGYEKYAKIDGSGEDVYFKNCTKYKNLYMTLTNEGPTNQACSDLQKGGNKKVTLTVGERKHAITIVKDPATGPNPCFIENYKTYSGGDEDDNKKKKKK